MASARKPARVRADSNPESASIIAPIKSPIRNHRILGIRKPSAKPRLTMTTANRKRVRYREVDLALAFLPSPDSRYFALSRASSILRSRFRTMVEI